MRSTRVSVLVIICMVLFLTGFTQVEQSNRFEVEIRAFDKPYDVINGGVNGILLIKQTDERNRLGDPKYELLSLDTALKTNWEKEMYINRFWEYRGYDYYDGNYYLLFKYRRRNSRDLKILKLNLINGDTVQYTVRNLVPIQLTEFEITENAALLGGYFNYNPLVIHYNLTTLKSKVLPAIYQNRTELIQIKVDDDKNAFVVIVSEKTFDKRNTLAVKTYHSSGELIGNEKLEPEEDKGLIYGRAAEFDYDISLLAGTYSTKRGTFSRGLFVARVNTNGEQKINYYNFADLENFFNYMKAKRRKRIANRIERKRINGKKIKFNYRLLVHDIIESEGQFIMIGEAFYPKYHTNSSFASNYSSYRGQQFYGSYFAGYRYTHAVVIGFDKKGKVLWDNSFEIEDVLTFNLEQFVHIDIKDDHIVLLYLYDNEIRSKIIKRKEVLEGKSFDAIKLSFGDDVLRDTHSEISGLESWYDDTFYAYGTQQIKNMKDTGVKLNRHVFYINKVKYR